MNTEKPVIYHNPRCSKSRQTLQLLQDQGHDPEIVQYLENPPDTAALERIADDLDQSVEAMIRTGEDEFSEMGLDKDSLDRETVINAITQCPKLMQRPIVMMKGRGARIGRPPEKVLELFD